MLQSLPQLFSPLRPSFGSQTLINALTQLRGNGDRLQGTPQLALKPTLIAAQRLANWALM
jgi:hypothetical protein